MTYFGKAELSPLWVVLGRWCQPQEQPPQSSLSPERGAWLPVDLHRTQGRFWGGGGGSCGSQGCLQQGHVQGGCCSAGTQQRLALCFHISLALDRISRLTRAQPGFGSPRELSSITQLSRGPNCVASPAGPYGAPRLTLVIIKSQTELRGTLKDLIVLGRDISH